MLRIGAPHRLGGGEFSALQQCPHHRGPEVSAQQPFLPALGFETAGRGGDDPRGERAALARRERRVRSRQQQGRKELPAQTEIVVPPPRRTVEHEHPFSGGASRFGGELRHGGRKDYPERGAAVPPRRTEKRREGGGLVVELARHVGIGLPQQFRRSPGEPRQRRQKKNCCEYLAHRGCFLRFPMVVYESRRRTSGTAFVKAVKI